MSWKIIPKPRFHSLTMLSIALMGIITGCKGVPTNLENDGSAISTADVSENQLIDHFNAKLENSFNAHDRWILYTDLLTLHDLQFPKLPELSIFSYVFGGNSSDNVLHYLDERIKYIFPPNAEIQINHDSLDGYQATEGVRVVAENLSSMLIFEQWVRPQSIVSLQFNGDGIRSGSTRTGVIQLGEAYMKGGSAKKPHTSISRILTLVHEARHSDCKTPFSADDIERVRAGKRLRNMECGYSHDICPTMLHQADGKAIPHPYAGFPACDSMPWGAYSVQGVLAMEIAKSCATCTESEQQEAKMIQIDSFMRFPKAKEMLRGELGLPDMESR